MPDEQKREMLEAPDDNTMADYWRDVRPATPTTFGRERGCGACAELPNVTGACTTC